MPTCPQLHHRWAPLMPFEKNLLCVKYIYTWKHLKRTQRRACPRRQKAAVCRILIGLSERLMPAFDVFQGSMPRPKPREKMDGNRRRDQTADIQTGGVYGLGTVYILVLEMVLLFARLRRTNIYSIVSASCEMKGQCWPAFWNHLALNCGAEPDSRIMVRNVLTAAI